MCKVWPKAVASNIFHLVLVWERGDSTLWILLAKFFVEKHEVCKASADLRNGFLKGCKVGLEAGSAISFGIVRYWWVMVRVLTYCRSN